jgi:hypothetical protein
VGASSWARDAAADALGGRPPRNRYVDLVRVFAILVVVVGHWLDTIVVIEDGLPVGQSALGEVGYMRWLTLVFQIMPLFFLAGGYAAAAGWASAHAAGGGWTAWTRARVVRLLRPTSWFLGILAAATAVAILLGAEPAVLAQAGWGVALQLWFLPVYLLLLVLAVPLIAAWDRGGWRSLALMVALVGVVDVLVRVGGVAAAGWASYLLAPASGFLLGVAWRAGAFRRQAVPLALLVGGALGLLVLIALLGYPPWMIGVPGEPPANTAPPNLALVAYSAAQIGLVLLLEPPLGRWLRRDRVWAAVVRGNTVVLTLFLWHMVPVLFVAALMGVLGGPAGPEPGSVAWWGLRPVWIGVLGVVLAGVVGLVGRFERPKPARGVRPGWVAPVLLVVGAALTGYALSRLALAGFAPSGHLAVGPLALYAAGAGALWASGRDPAAGAGDAR